ncbi:MAG: helix-turn-helix domain-containing protein, partial [Pseudomonadota bacterium]
MNYEEEKQARAETSGHRTSGGEPDPLGVLERLKEALGARTDAECARLLGVKPQNVSQARSSGQVPPGWVYAAAYGHGASADWIWFGEGPRTRVGDGPDPGEFGYVPMARAELS